MKPSNMIYIAVGLPMFRRILPRERCGQFCSFNAICSAEMGAVGGLVVGGFINLMRRAFPDAVWGKDYCYRMIPAWNLPSLLFGLFFIL